MKFHDSATDELQLAMRMTPRELDTVAKALGEMADHAGNVEMGLTKIDEPLTLMQSIELEEV